MKAHLATALAGYGSGFHFTVPPPPDVANLKHLRSPDPDDVLGCVLANFQRGGFETADALLRLLQRDDSDYVWSAATNLLAYGAPGACIRSFFSWAHGEPDEVSRFDASTAALLAGGLWAVEPTLAALPILSDPNLRSITQTNLSWVLEEAPGAIYEGPTLVSPDPEESPLFSESQPYPDDRGYAKLVRGQERLVRVGRRLGDQSTVVEGELVNFENVTRRLLKRVRFPAPPQGRVEQGWMFFAATTGVDCRDFFDGEGRLRHLTAAALLEAYLASGAVERFEPGVRYFFGHRIPD